MRFLSTTCIVLLLTGWAFASGNQEINYQAQLTYSNGDPIDSTVAVTFDIYTTSTGGTSLWTETHSSVTVTDGIFDVILGQSTTLPDTLFGNNPDLWIESTLGTTTITPRTQLTGVPWAFDAGLLDGIDGSGYARDPHDHLNEIWDNTGGATALTINNGDHGFRVTVDSTAINAKGITDGIPVISAQNMGSATIGLICGRDGAGLTRPPSRVGATGRYVPGGWGSLGTEREGVFGISSAAGVEGAIGCMIDPQLNLFPVGVYGYASLPQTVGGMFYNDGGQSAPGMGDDWALIIGQGHLSAAGWNPGLNPTTPSPPMGPANVASILLGGPAPWMAGASPVSGLGASYVFIPDQNVTITSLIWIMPTINPYPGAFPGPPPAGIWCLDTVGNCGPLGQGFIVTSTAVEGPVDFVYLVIN